MIRWISMSLLLTCASMMQVAPFASDAETEVREVEKRRLEALVRNDLETLDQILSSDLTYTHSNGRVETKEEFLESLRSGRVRYRGMDPQDVRIRVYDGTGILTGEAGVRITVQGEDREFALRFTLVYVRRDGRWQKVAWQSTRLP